MQTLKEIAGYDREYLVPAQISEILNVSPQYVREAARKCPGQLGFPVIIIGDRVKIPRIPFLVFMGWSAREGSEKQLNDNT